MEKNDYTQEISEIKKYVFSERLKEASKLVDKLYKKDRNNPKIKFLKCFVDTVNSLYLYRQVPTEKLRNELKKESRMCVGLLESLSIQARRAFFLQEWDLINYLAGIIRLANLPDSLVLRLIDLFLEVNPNHYDALYKKTNFLLDVGRIEEAMRISQKMLEKHPDDIRFMTSLANGYALLGLEKMHTNKERADYFFNEAKSIAEKVLKRNPHDCEIRWLIASIASVRDSYENALKMVEEALYVKECSQYYKLLELKADLLLKLGRYKEALEMYNNLIDMNRLYIGAWRGLTMLWDLLGEYKKSLEAAKMAYFLNPYDVDIVVDYVTALRDNRKYKDAQKVLDAALEVYPNNLELLVQRALIELVSGKYKEAKKSFLKLISLNPPQEKVNLWAQIWFGLGHIEYLNGNYSKAMEYAERVLRIIPNDADSLALKARIHVKRGEIQNAIECYKKIYETTEYLSTKKIVLEKIRELTQK